MKRFRSDGSSSYWIMTKKNCFFSEFCKTLIYRVHFAVRARDFSGRGILIEKMAVFWTPSIRGLEQYRRHTLGWRLCVGLCIGLCVRYACDSLSDKNQNNRFGCSHGVHRRPSQRHWVKPWVTLWDRSVQLWFNSHQIIHRAHWPRIAIWHEILACSRLLTMALS